MTRITRNARVSIMLILADFIGFTFSIYIAMGILQLTLSHFHDRIPEAPTEGWISLHWTLAFCCIGWFGMRLRHYFYRKSVLFGLKEILPTLVKFAVFEIAMAAFSQWYFSSY